jgi:predicted component of type VI protein secretion system
MLKLQVVHGNATGTEIPVEDELVIGRTGPEEGRLGDDPELSRQHARVIRSGEAYLVEDLGSMNGTFVNGNRLAAPHELSDGDQIELGGSRIVTQLEQPAAAPAEAPPAVPQPSDDIGATRIAGVPEVPEPPPARPAADTYVPQPEPTGEGPQAPGPPPAPAPPPVAPPEPPPAAAEPPAPPEAGPEAPPPDLGPQAPATADMPPPQGPPQDTATPAPVPPWAPAPAGPPQDTVTPPPAPPAEEPADLPPPQGPPQETVTPAPVPVEEPPRIQDTEVPEPAPAEEAVPAGEPEPKRRPPVSLRLQVDVDAGEATIELDEGGDRVRLRHEDGRWVLEPD